jgi:hypothetical protein
LKDGSKTKSRVKKKTDKMASEEGEMSLSERFDLMSRQLDHQRLRMDELEDEVRLLKNKESVVLQLVSLEAAKMMVQQQQPVAAARGGGGESPRGRRRSRSPSPVQRSPPVQQQRVTRRHSSIDSRRRSPVAASRSRSPVSKKRNVPNRCIHVSHLHHLNATGRIALTDALYNFFGSYGQVDDVYLADNEKWAKITFNNDNDVSKFFDSHHNSSDTVKCAPFQSGGKGSGARR